MARRFSDCECAPVLCDTCLQNVTRCPYCRKQDNGDAGADTDVEDNENADAAETDANVYEAGQVAMVLRWVLATTLLGRNQFLAEGATVSDGNVVSCDFGGRAEHSLVLKPNMFFSFSNAYAYDNDNDNDNYTFVAINGFYLFACESSVEGGVRILVVRVRKYDEAQPDQCKFRVHALPMAY